ncbi:hypothetical protein KDH_28270 [Dictyobacter sp. S3.2.2.5]|uniref:Uncharacterized protein n=1 Tax=Dictyobacter halimunensis TaxID=3026934 RepID=A0ABQ6FTY5_9CHLR|nr:hypothetical protein KDH_28270 [Dictyobacter sp. S3.2.2.5]
MEGVAEKARGAGGEGANALESGVDVLEARQRHGPGWMFQAGHVCEHPPA